MVFLECYVCSDELITLCIVRECDGVVMGRFVCVRLNVCQICVVLVCVCSLSMCDVFCIVCNVVMGNCLD